MPQNTRMRITLVQSALAWEQPEANYAHFRTLLAPLAGQTDLVVLPETFASGFSMAWAGRAEEFNGPSAAFLLEQARALDAAVTGSAFVRTPEGVRNRSMWALPDGTLRHYDKKHLFRMAGEHEHFTPGGEPLVLEWRGARFAALVCYDLRFPVWSRRRAGYEYDVLVYVANWPSRRRNAWQQLLKARAIENQCIVVGVNRVGDDGNGIPHAGDSAIIDALGMPVVELTDAPAVSTVSVDLAAMRAFRDKFPFHLDADGFRFT